MINRNKHVVKSYTYTNTCRCRAKIYFNSNFIICFSALQIVLVVLLCFLKQTCCKYNCYCKFGNLGFFSRETSHMRSFAKVKSSQNGKSLCRLGKSCLSREFKTSLICILTLLAKKILAKFSEFTVCKNFPE